MNIAAEPQPKVATLARAWAESPNTHTLASAAAAFGCYKFRMAFQPLDWFRNNANGTPLEPRRQFLAGLIVWVLAWLVVWWNQDVRVALSVRATSNQSVPQSSGDPTNTLPEAASKAQQVLGIKTSSSDAAITWLGTFIGLGLFWGGGLLIYRPLTGWGFCLSWLRRFHTIERLSLVSATVLTLSAIVLHWFWSHIHAWMVAAAVAIVVLAFAFGWKLPGKKES